LTVSTTGSADILFHPLQVANSTRRPPRGRYTVFRIHPPTSRLTDPKLQVVQVEPFRVGTDFKIAAAPARVADYPRHVDIAGFAPIDQPSGRMRKNREVRVVHRLEDACRLPGAG
jgi:hypothetical protein